MRTSTLNAYLYQQYADDDDLQAFVAAYNQATQTYIDWFNQVILPYYPGLTGDLLTWVIQGVYGLPRTQLASPLTPAVGPLNTAALNTIAIDAFTPSSEQFYELTDDVYQRILTWDFFKGDGKKFNIRWLKRRIMRFIMGANGVDPQPSHPGFTIGAETTSAIGVLISSGTLTVSINQSLLSLQANVPPGILTLFKLAFEGGSLDLPVQYSYVCNIITGFVALAHPNILTSATSAFTQTTGITGVTALGGTGLYTYAWTWQSGGTGITINSPSSANTSFTASGLAYGQTVTGIALCTVTDTVSSLTALATCEVIITCVAPSMIGTEDGINAIGTEGGIALIVEP